MKSRLINDDDHHDELFSDTEEVVVKRHPRTRIRMLRMLFFAQLLISLAALIFCGSMVAYLVSHDGMSCEVQPFIAILSAIVGYWLPNPKVY